MMDVGDSTELTGREWLRDVGRRVSVRGWSLEGEGRAQLSNDG